MKYSEHFSTFDFPEGRPAHRLLERLESVRIAYGKPIYITSGGRTKEHNEDIGGASDSAHIIDQNGEFSGCDISCKNSRTRSRLLPHILKHFHRVGIYDEHIHADVDLSKDPDVTWVGKSK